MTCWGCTKHEQTGLDGFIQAGCIKCEAREIACGPAAHGRDAAPELVQAEMRAQWPEEKTYRQGRALVWAHIKKREGQAA